MSNVLWVLQWALTILGLFYLGVWTRRGVEWLLIRKPGHLPIPNYMYYCPDEQCTFTYFSRDKSVVEAVITQHESDHKGFPCRYEKKDGGTLGQYWVCTVHGRQPLTLKPIDENYDGPCLGVSR